MCDREKHHFEEVPRYRVAYIAEGYREDGLIEFTLEDVCCDSLIHYHPEQPIDLHRTSLLSKECETVAQAWLDDTTFVVERFVFGYDEQQGGMCATVELKASGFETRLIAHLALTMTTK